MSKLSNIHITVHDGEVHGNTVVLTLGGKFDYENETYDFLRRYEFSIHNNESSCISVGKNRKLCTLTPCVT